MTIPPSDDLCGHVLALRSFTAALCSGPDSDSDSGGIEGADLYVAAVPLDGRLAGDPLPLNARGRYPSAYLELGSGGDFRFDSVPEGSYELWVGTLPQLKNRAPSIRHTIEVRPWEINAAQFELR